MKRFYSLTIFVLLCCASVYSSAEVERLKMATTTSTDNSALLAVLNPPFEKKYGVKLDVISVGTGKAIRLGKNGDVDLILVHAPGAEKKFVNEGSGIERQPVMHNDFVIVGSANDPAKLKNAKDMKQAMTRLMEEKHIFISRGDDSGTHKKEKNLWAMAGEQPTGTWYLSVGQGMGIVLRIADDKEAYTLTDRGTYLAYKDKMKLRVLFEKDDALYNPYHVIMVNPEKHPHTKIDLARKYSEFIRSEEGQSLIRNFKVNGEVLFHPDVIK
ncbi:MAG TPA: tungsten ABC transporter substrate-binding protein [Thiotrichaceae bacterium]|nr:tungsten ABC transporter substrate-binding protein [Thiotrichaceae bacterium]HIM07558.1 tungsten ABC transporter substrate-binding protein [Gammaproteobacteria bacterium]